ncbi:YDR387C [Zygosaccharomyces parabailii]|nr:YDR387C [Zygosaccharomyces parabailii]
MLKNIRRFFSMDCDVPRIRQPRPDASEEVYSDLYSTFSQVTSTTANDIEQLPYPLTFRNAVIFAGATVGGLLFGYDTGIISGVLLMLNPADLSLSVVTDFDKELITSVTCLGSFFGSLLAFSIADRYGRRLTLALCSAVFIVAALWMALATTLSLLVTGRLLVGVAVGVAAQCIPVYLSEISPASTRGTVLALNCLAITGGQLISYVVSMLVQETKHAWRYLFGLAALPAIFFLLLLDFIPESPRWLISHGDYAGALDSLKVIYPLAPMQLVSLKLKWLILDINKLRKYQDEEDLPLARSQSISRYLGFTQPEEVHAGSEEVSTETKPRHRMEARAKRALFVGCTLMFFQQASGINAFMYYAPVIFAQIEVQNPLASAMIIAATNFLFTLVALRFVDRVGRRYMLLSTIWIMTVGLLLSSVGFDEDNTKLILVAFLIFVGGYASAMGTIPWSSVEFLPLNRRSFGGACISCTNWLTNTLVSVSYLSIGKKVGMANTMLIFALFTALNWIFVYYYYPEVKGLTLEEVGKVFENGIDVSYVYRNYH